MSHISCEKHGLICSIKTGSSEGSPNFGKTFYLCPLYPNECSFMQPSSMPPQFCKYHDKNMIDLKIYKVLPTGETMEYSRCKESKNTSRKFCCYQKVKNKPDISPDNKIASQDELAVSSTNKEDTKEIHSVTCKSEKQSNSNLAVSLPKESATLLSEQQPRQSSFTSRINSSYRETVQIHSSSSDEESDTDNDWKIHHHSQKEVNKKQVEHKVTDDNENALIKSLGSTINTEQEKSLRQAIDKKKKIYKMADISKLPDKGARLKTEIEGLETALSKLQVIDENHVLPSSRKHYEENKENSVEDINMHSLLSQNKVRYSPFSQTPASFHTFEDFKDKKEKEQSASTKNKAMLISPLPQASSFEKYRNRTESHYHSQASMDEATNKISDAMVGLQKSLNSFPNETQEEENPVILETPLLSHQRYALAWLLWRESHFPYGGIFADDMGLGKSLTMISLILKHKENMKNKEHSSSDREKLYIVGPTLVVCPASLIYHWKNEILKHCKVESVKIYIFHGPNRTKDSEKLCKYDVIITTYETVSADVQPDLKQEKEKNNLCMNPRQGSALSLISWERIILDEAHKVKNPVTLMSQCICCLQSKYRWAVTGTPIHNNLGDLYSLVKFLRFSPFDDSILWKKYVSGMESLMKTLIKYLLLRRTKDQTDKKGKCLVQLPPKKIHIVELKLTRKERDIYDKLHNFCKSRMEIYLGEKENKPNDGLLLENVKRRSNKANVKIDASFFLVMLLRLQQCCCHLALLQKVIEIDNKLLHKDKTEDDLSQKLTSLSVNNSNHDVLPESPPSSISDISPDSSSVKDCGLNFELLGLSSYIDDADFRTEANSTKVSSILNELVKIRNQTIDGRMEKCVLVSQWVSFLEIMAVHIKSKKFRFSMISGNIKTEERMSIIDDFNHPSGKEILLLSLKAGGAGLNLIGGNHLFLLDTHWNPALENQACDRIYRLGQTKNVFIHKFICMGTIEEKIVRLQKEKLNLARNVLEGGNLKLAFNLRDIQELLKF